MRKSKLKSKTLSESKEDKADRIEEEYLNQYLDAMEAENYWNMLEFQDERDKTGKED